MVRMALGECLFNFLFFFFLTRFELIFRYAKNIKYRSKLLQDVPISQIDNAIFWIEYVIRHKGAPHLRSPALDLAWYQLYLLDVYAFIASALAVSLFIIFKVLRCCKAVCRRNKENVSSKKKKKN